MDYIFSKNYDEDRDRQLISEALHGSEDALTALIRNHQNYIYNIAFKMVLSPYDAEDITQEILIKMITKLSHFRGEASFRTWLYRLTVNHCLTMKKKWLEERYPTFSYYEDDLDSIPASEESEFDKIENADLIEEARLGCLAGMILCLNREQRMVYILGELFLVPHDVGAEIMSISKDNFRQRLSRARTDIYQFMHKKCGLINKSNPCRCQKKTKGFIAAGWVDPDTMKFNTSYFQRINQLVPDKDKVLKRYEWFEYKELQRMHPFQEKSFIVESLQRLIHSPDICKTFEL